MGSILNQLKKYQPPQEETSLTLPNNKISKVGENRPITTVALDIGVNARELAKVPQGNYANILYPFELACIYYLVRNGRFIPDAENKCNKFIEDFMTTKINQIGYEEYFKLYQKAMTPQIQRLAMLRVLVASFGIGEGKMDAVPANLREQACSFLGLQIVTHDQAMKLIEKEYPQCSIEDQILGRLGYLMVWKNLCGLERLALPFKP